MPRIYLFTTVILLAAGLLLVSCGPHLPPPQLLPPVKINIKTLAQEGLRALGDGRYTQARQYFEKALRYSPDNCQLNFFNALSYQLEGRDGDSKLLEWAEVGYKLAIRFCPTDPWPRYFYGLIQMTFKNYPAAEALFESAETFAVTRKDMIKFMASSILAAYKGANYLLADQLIKQLDALDPANPLVASLKKYVAQMAKADKEQKKIVEALEAQRRTPVAPARLKNQLFLDAVLIVSKQTRTEAQGDNLLTGLTIQYGNGTTPGLLRTANTFLMGDWRAYLAQTNNLGANLGSFPAAPYSRTITSIISIPAVTYSLNIFNTADEQSEILSRPTLLAEDGIKATYFSGKNFVLGVQGTQIGMIQNFLVGITLALTPTFLSDSSVNLAIEIGRETLAAASNQTTFQQVLETTKENTATTANVHFGETIILSGLTEKVETETNNFVPVLGRIPLVKYLFSRHTKERQQTTLLILITPRPFISFSSAYPDVDRRELEMLYNHMIEPYSDLNHIVRHLRYLKLYQTPPIVVQSLYDSATLRAAMYDEYNSI